MRLGRDPKTVLAEAAVELSFDTTAKIAANLRSTKASRSCKFRPSLAVSPSDFESGRRAAAS